MKTILLCASLLAFTSPVAWGQESATQQQLDKISGQIQDILDAQAQQGRRIDALEKEISDLRDKVNTPVANDYANRDDLKKLAEQVQKIEQNRQDDKEEIMKQIENLGKAIAAAPVIPAGHRSTPPPKSSDTTETGPQKGYEYEVKQCDTLGLIVKAYREQGVRVTKSQIIAANPKMNPNVLIPGRKIFIPDPSAK